MGFLGARIVANEVPHSSFLRHTVVAYSFYTTKGENGPLLPVEGGLLAERTLIRVSWPQISADFAHLFT
jgi:hypothetical protein